MANNTTINFKGTFDVGDVLQGIDRIKKDLDTLSLGPKTQAEFDSLFQKIERNAEKATKAMASGFKNRGDVKRYEDAVHQITTGYDDIITKIKVLNSTKKIHLNIDDKAIKSVISEIETLTKKWKQAESNLSTQKRDSSKILEKTADKYKGGAAAWNDAVTAFKNGDIAGTEQAIRRLEATIKAAKTRAGNNPLSSDWKERAEDVDKMREALDKYKGAQGNVSVAYNDLESKQKEFNNYVEKGAKVLTATADAGEKEAKSIKESAKASVEAARGTQELNSELDQFKNKAAYFFGLSNAINLFKRAVRSAYETVKDLDAVMTETAVVTPFSVGDMWSQLPEYTQRANELGVTIHDTYEAATLFYQQGLKTNEVMAISNETLKMARIAGLDAATASDRMTNALRGFNMELDKTSAQRVNDVYSKLAAITASNTDEISTAMTKVASLAHNANMEFETTAAFLAQIIESTRESAETAGTALKTVVARFSEVKKLYSKGELLGEDEEGEQIDVNKVSTALRSADISLNEYLTGAKGLDDIFMELAEKWDSLDQVQQRYIATMAAGSRQQSRFIALMSDYKRTVQLVEAANNANGASEEQYGKTLESLQTKLARLKNAWNEFILGLTNSDAIKGAVDLLTGLITAINNLIKLISGKNAGVKMIATFFTAFTTFKVGSSIIGKNNSLTKLFEQFTGIGKQAALKSADLIGDVWRNGLTDTLKKGFNDKLDKSILYNYFAPLKSIGTNFKVNDIEDFRNKLLGDKDMPMLNLNQSKVINAAIDTGKIEEVNKALKDQQIQLQINEENAERFGVTCEDVTERSADGWRIASAAAAVLGGILMSFGSTLEKQEGAWKDFGTVIKSFGTGLIVFGTIMSVYLPLQAQLMAQGVTGAIVSIPIVGWIAGLISLLVSLGIVIHNIVKNNSLETKLANAAEDLKNASEAAVEAKEAYEELGAAWDSLDDKYDAIEKATKGTQQWRDAIKEANNAVLELMNTYGLVNVTRDENGILQIDDKEKEGLNKKMAADASKAAAGERVAKINQVELQQQSAFDTMREDVFNYDFIQDLQDEGELDKLIGLTTDEIQNFANEKWGDTIEDGGEVFNENEARLIQDYVKKYFEKQKTIDAQNLGLGAEIIQGTDFDRKKYGVYANNFVDEKFVNKLVESKIKDLEGMGDEDVQRLYAEAHHYDSYQGYKDDHPDDKTSTEGMKGYVAGANAFEAGSEQLKNFIGKIDELEDYQKDFFAGGLTKQDLISFSGYSEKNIEDFWRDSGGEAIGPLEDFIQRFYEEIGEAESSFKLKGFTDEFKNNLSTSLTNGLTSDAFKGLVDNLWSVYASSGIEGMNTVQESISKMTKEVEPDKINDFIRSLQSVNWKSTDSIRTLTELAEEYGVSEDAIKEFENQIIDLNNATSKVDLEGLTSVLGIAKKIGNGEQGRSFSKDDYEKLVQNGAASEDDFVYNIETGNYDYIGKDIEDVRAAIIEQTKILSGQLDKELGSDEAVQKTIDQLGEVENVENEGELTTFLRKYIDNAGDDSLINTSVLGGTLEQKQAAYDQIMEAYSREADTREQLGQVNAGLYQNNTAAENIGLIQSTNSEDARKALLQQISTSGLPEEVISTFIAAIENVPVNASAENGYLSHNGEMVGNVMTTLDEASELGISAEDLNEYVEALKQVDNLENEQIDILYELALANAKYLQGLEKVTNSYDDWIELKQEDGSIKPEEGNDIQSKAYTQLKKDLKEMLNLSEDVSDEFLQIPGTADLLQKAIEGDISAVAELRAQAAKLDLGSKLTDEVSAAIDNLSEASTTLEFGASFDDTEFAQALYDMLVASGATVDEINKAFEDIGWTAPIETEEVPYTSAEDLISQGYGEYVDAEGIVHKIPTEGNTEISQTGTITVPKIGSKESSRYVKPSIPSPKTKSSSGSGGGGGSTKKPSYWKNPYDELYNLQEKINEALRRREALERRYQKLLKQEQATLADIRKSYYAQINNLRTEADLQKQFAAGRLRQIQNVGSQIYTDDEGNRSTFSSLGVTKYASYNANTGLIQIDWEGLEAIANDSSREEEGKAAEAYISKLEELVSSYEEVRDKLWEIEDKIEDLRDAAIDSYLSFEDRVKEALVNSYQQQIDSYQAMSDAIEKANSEVIDSLREQIDLSRQIRDNTEKEKDISDMENRLAYLQRDTSGANALEILKLQKDLENAREGYADTLVDQAIDKMQNDADLAAEQRARQIETMQEQLEIMQNTGALWNNVYKLMNEAAEGDGALSPHSNLVKLLQETEAFASLSNIGQAKWWSEVAEEFHAAWVGLSEAEDKYKKDANNDGTIYDSGTKNAIEEVQQAPATQPEPTTTTDTKSGYDEKTKYGVALAVCDGYWGNGDTRRRNLESKGFNYSEIQSIVNKVLKSSQNGSWYGKYYGITDVSQYKMSKFKTGGLADFTGPAWLDGTKSRPELILNAQDSANFIALKDILASLLNVQGPGGALRGGDNYYDVDITASIGSDYDVDRLAKRIKEDIYQDGQYRNVNTLSYLR